jgi:SAM-dependent methyltransferase
MDELSFSHYLLAKRSVDDRALNRQVWQALTEKLARFGHGLQVLEMGAGVGTMFQRAVEWQLFDHAEYTLVDEMGENMRAARQLLSSWADQQGFTVSQQAEKLALTAGETAYLLEFTAAEMDAFLDQAGERRWDLIIANAFLDLVDTRAALSRLRDVLRPGGMLYLTINFDGLTAFEPPCETELDERVISLYHRTMDERDQPGQASGGSRTGRHLFTWAREAGLSITAAGSSDWLVYPRGGSYPDDEAYFLGFILHFFEDSLSKRAELSAEELARWLAERRAQIERGELVFMAHQYDFLLERQ